MLGIYGASRWRSDRFDQWRSARHDDDNNNRDDDTNEHNDDTDDEDNDSNCDTDSRGFFCGGTNRCPSLLRLPLTGRATRPLGTSGPHVVCGEIALTISSTLAEG